jgi:hypothetical protein
LPNTYGYQLSALKTESRGERQEKGLIPINAGHLVFFFKLIAES